MPHRTARSAFFLACLAIAGATTLIPGTAHAQCGAADLFGPPQQFATGAGPRSVAIGDLNGDGVPDLVVTNRISDSVSVLLGNGDGTFQPRQDFATGIEPEFLAIGDLNGDGIPDLAVASSTSNIISVLLGNGDGTFQPRQDIPAGGTPLYVAIGDFDGDGVLDLAVTNSNSDLVSVLLGNGDGTFQPPQQFATPSGPWSLAIGDLNADGNLDLVFSNRFSNSVSVLLGNGDGTFQPRHDFVTGIEPLSVAIGDLNGNGVPDLAVANRGPLDDPGNTVSVLLGNGDGTFQPRQDFVTGIEPVSVAIGDLNGDGTPDLTIANSTSNSISVLLGNGDGTFQPRQDFGVTLFPSFVAIIDLDNNGTLDLVIPNGFGNTVGILLNQCDPVLCTGDTNGDGVVDIADLNAVLANFGNSLPVYTIPNFQMPVHAAGDPGDDPLISHLVTIPFGTYEAIEIEFDFVNPQGGSWASDMQMSAVFRNGLGRSFLFRGSFVGTSGAIFNPAVFNETSTWDFDGSQSSSPGTYTHSYRFEIDAVQSEIFPGTPSRLAVDFTDIYNGGYGIHNFRFRLIPSGGFNGDTNGDGVVDLADLNNVLAEFGNTCP